MKVLKYSLLALSVSFFLSACEQTNSNAQSNKDLSTDEKVIAELDRIHETTFEERDLCILRPKAFKYLILIGYFAHDRGCDGDEVFYKGEHGSTSDFIKRALNDAGWSSKDKRLELALDFTDDVLYAWESLVWSEPEGLSQYTDHKFAKPSADFDDSNVVVITWVQEPAGMLCESNYRLVEVTFTEGGQVQDYNIITRVTVPC